MFDYLLLKGFRVVISKKFHITILAPLKNITGY